MQIEPENIAASFSDLYEREPIRFPAPYKKLKATSKKGVYVVLSPTGIVLHVGNTPRARSGINQRLKFYLGGKSSFAKQFLKPRGKNLRVDETLFEIYQRFVSRAAA